MLWQRNMVIFDTNMILRYLLNDNEVMAQKAEQYLRQSDVHVTIEVMAEVVYVMMRVYHLERREAAETLLDFLPLVKCREMDALRLALKTFGGKKLDFVDCVLYAYHEVHGAEIATYDKKLRKLIEKA